MQTNGRDVPEGTELKAQVCVVGSGPAGITVAWYLQKAGIDVILIEGSREHGGVLARSWPDKDLLYAGDAVGLFEHNEPGFLTSPLYQGQSPSERERFFGGTSTHWGGQSRPLDAVDFEARPGFPGWPIARADLDPWYAEAADFCMLHGDDFTAEYWAGTLGLPPSAVPRIPGFDTCMYQFLGGDFLDFATRKFPDGSTISDSRARVILNASLLEIEQQDGSVARLRVASMTDTDPPEKNGEFFIRADVCVLACGAVANAQQLLLSNVGNEHDQVGRYFMCHPLSMGTNVSITQPFLTAAQSDLVGGNRADGSSWRDANGVRVTGRFQLDADTLRQYNIGNCWMRSYSAAVYFEMAPNPDSRITLIADTDPVFGQRQVQIDWQLSPLDQTTYETSTALFKAAVNTLGGDISAPPWSRMLSAFVVNGHHLGTTRMSNDPTRGVVDANLKVHSLDNLYVAGASVFVTAGVSNPTFTIIALSIRLADHLRAKLAAT